MCESEIFTALLAIVGERDCEPARISAPHLAKLRQKGYEERPNAGQRGGETLGARSWVGKLHRHHHNKLCESGTLQAIATTKNRRHNEHIQPKAPHMQVIVAPRGVQNLSDRVSGQPSTLVRVPLCTAEELVTTRSPVNTSSSRPLTSTLDCTLCAHSCTSSVTRHSKRMQQDRIDRSMRRRRRATTHCGG